MGTRSSVIVMIVDAAQKQPKLLLLSKKMMRCSGTLMMWRLISRNGVVSLLSRFGNFLITMLLAGHKATSPDEGRNRCAHAMTMSSLGFHNRFASPAGHTASPAVTQFPSAPPCPTYAKQAGCKLLPMDLSPGKLVCNDSTVEPFPLCSFRIGIVNGKRQMREDLDRRS